MAEMLEVVASPTARFTTRPATASNARIVQPELLSSVHWQRLRTVSRTGETKRGKVRVVNRVRPVLAAVDIRGSASGGKAMTTARLGQPDPAELIARLVERYALTARERRELASVLTAFAPAERAAMLREQLRNILAARELATLPPLTTEIVERARRAIERGAVPGVVGAID